jgi:dTMP kinase
MKKGRLLVFEGLDGSGKQTQSQLLYERLKKNGYPVRKVSYPRYDNESSALVRMYLRGEFGQDANEISPYICSTFYAVDRYASYKQDYEEFYKNGGIVIADRYTTSNMLHQASKIQDKNKRKNFLDWLYNFEFKIYGLPVPDLVFFLDLSVEDTFSLTKNRANKITGEEKKDIHETNPAHLSNAHDIAYELIEKYSWTKIKCISDQKIRSIEDISNDIYKIFLESEGLK